MCRPRREVARVPESCEERTIFDNRGVEEPVVELGLRRDSSAHPIFAAVGKRNQQRANPAAIPVEVYAVLDAFVSAPFTDSDDDVRQPATPAGAAR